MAFGRSPQDHALVALATGELLELDIDAIGGTIKRVIGETAEPVHCLHTDTQGTIWITCDDGLYRLPASKSLQAPHKVWEQKPGRLPGGGNHDIFAVSCEGRLFMAGGLTRFWGYPTSERVFDDLFSYDPDNGFWEVASQLSFPRRYSGIAELNGRVWIVGGEGELGARGGEPTTLDVVEIYDPATGAWSTGPTLQQVRTDPFVMVCDERIWAVGGASDPTTKLQSVESIGTGESVWRAEPDLHATHAPGRLLCAALRSVLCQRRRFFRLRYSPGKVGCGRASTRNHRARASGSCLQRRGLDDGRTSVASYSLLRSGFADLALGSGSADAAVVGRGGGVAGSALHHGRSASIRKT